MSFAGHIHDMIRRDKENRELRKNLRGRMKANQKGIIGSYRNCDHVAPEELDKIRKGLKEKSLWDENRMGKEFVIFLLAGIVIILLFICAVYFL